MLGRLRHESARLAAAGELRAINRRIFPLWQSSYQDEKASWSLMDLKTHVTGDVGMMAGLALTAVGLVWLIACTNASSLLIARVTSGAGSWPCVRRSGPRVAAWSGTCWPKVLFSRLAPPGWVSSWPGWASDFCETSGRRLSPHGRNRTRRAGVVASVGLTAASALLFGLVPSVHGSGGPVDESLRSVGRSSTGSVAVRRLRQALVGTQFAIATPLLVVAGLLLVSLDALGRVNLGFDTHNLLSGSISLPAVEYAEPGRVATFWNELQRRVEALPGVSGVTFADGRPSDVGNFNNFDREASPTPPGQSQPVTPWVSVTPEYFGLLGLSHLEGRLFDQRDGLGSNIEVVVVDRAWAKRFFPNESAVGKRFREGGCTTCPWTTVVGVVSDVKYAGLDVPDEGAVYTPMAGREVSSPIEDATTRFRYLILRTRTDPGVVLPAVRQIVRALDRSLPFSGVATIDDLVAQSLQRPRSMSLLVGGFALVALILSVVGIYGVMAYYVEQHTKDISIRLVLGGRPMDVLRLIVGQGMKVVRAESSSACWSRSG